VSDNRNLTDEDVTEIVKGLKAELVKDFYGEVGKGVWGFIKKAFFALLILLAVYGVTQDKAVLRAMAQAGS
jgi:hypothetical protein